MSLEFLFPPLTSCIIKVNTIISSFPTLQEKKKRKEKKKSFNVYFFLMLLLYIFVPLRENHVLTTVFDTQYFLTVILFVPGAPRAFERV